MHSGGPCTMGAQRSMHHQHIEYKHESSTHAHVEIHVTIYYAI